MAMFVYKGLASFTPGFFSTEPKLIPNFVAENLSPKLKSVLPIANIATVAPKNL